MTRPDNLTTYDELDLKLGIKSSLPNVKSTLALAILLWECADERVAELIYSQQNGDEIVLSDELEQRVIDCLVEICDEENIDLELLISKINENQLFKSQLEALIVAFELIWKLAQVKFVDERPASAERTGRIRYPKKLIYSLNIDVIHSLISSKHNDYMKVLLSWIGFDINDVDSSCENSLKQLLTSISEGAVYKLTDGDSDIIFNQNSIYKKILETQEEVNINDDDEAKGPLRILKTTLADGINPYLQYSNGNVTSVEPDNNSLNEYQKRVDTFLRLSKTKNVVIERNEQQAPQNIIPDYERIRLTTGQNVLLYGVPGSGKSWTIEHEYKKPDSKSIRLVFHPDYTYSDFIGQILPCVSEKGQVSYEFTPGPFTSILRDAYLNPQTEYLLIIEEINRGNAPSIFGEVFQLLDRKTEIKDDSDDGFPIGTSEYSIVNKDIGAVVYGKENAYDAVRIPSNLSIIGTMNTSDQNVFTLDTAFQRRWDMRLIENNFDNVSPRLADALILDTEIKWKDFCTEINNIILQQSLNIPNAEDKRLGVHFVRPKDLDYDRKMGDLNDGVYDSLRKEEQKGKMPEDKLKQLTEIRDAIKQNSKFPEKVIKYLWDDAFKFNREDVFNTAEYKSLEQVIHAFLHSSGPDRFKVFNDNIRNAFSLAMG